VINMAGSKKNNNSKCAVCGKPMKNSAESISHMVEHGTNIAYGIKNIIKDETENKPSKIGERAADLEDNTRAAAKAGMEKIKGAVKMKPKEMTAKVVKTAKRHMPRTTAKAAKRRVVKATSRARR
jgi:hypothetical protein